jgi:hypothetical protein
MAKRSYYKVPKKVSEMTEEELEAFASAVYDDLMAQFATDETTSEDSDEKNK